MKPLKYFVFFIALTTLFACNYEAKQDIETNTLSEFIPVSKIIDSDWAAVANWVTKAENAVKLLVIKCL